MKENIIISTKVLLFFTLLLGIVYPLFITGVGQLFFPYKANGSIIKINKKPVGSELLGQEYKNDSLFWGRPSFNNYNPLKSGSSNYSVNSKKLFDLKEKQLTLFKVDEKKISQDLLYYSGSGLDPHITREGARIQADRIAKTNNIDIQVIYDLIDRHLEKKQFQILGEERINVLLLNLDLKKMKYEKSK